jgi:hypothetical protein
MEQLSDSYNNPKGFFAMLRTYVRTIRLKIFLSCVILILLFGCESIQNTQIPVPGDGGLFSSGNTCSPPCFWDIFPGVSTEADVIRVLKAKSVYANCKVFNYEEQGGVRGISCSIGPVITYQQGNDLVSSIGIQPSQLITVGDVIKAFRNPSGVLVTLIGTPEENQFTSMILYYDQIFTVLVLYDQQGYYFDLQPTTPIKNIGYNGSISYITARQSSSTWAGYGKYGQFNH